MKTVDKKAFLTNFELGCEGAIISTLTDVYWVICDASGFHNLINYIGIGLGLTIGIGIIIFALNRHHQYYTHRLFMKKHKKSVKRNYVFDNQGF